MRLDFLPLEWFEIFSQTKLAKFGKNHQAQIPFHDFTITLYHNIIIIHIMFFGNIFRNQNKSKSKSRDSLLDKVRILDHEDGDAIEIDYFFGEKEDKMPYIEAINSFSPTASLTSSTSQNTIDTLREDLKSSNKKVSFHLSTSPASVSNIYQSDDYYFSMEDVDDLMLNPDALDQYQTFKEQQSKANTVDEKRHDRQLRRALIQEELDILVQNCEENDELQGHEFEPEAIEALGIAANKLAYLRKFYDVAKCEYIFAPSVAYTIMDGTLLEEANKHYFGKSDEFLVMYAGAMGSSILTQRAANSRYMDLNRDESPLAEDIDLGFYDDDDDESDIELDRAQVMKMVWGVSPQAVGLKKFTFDNQKKAQKSRKIGFKSILSVLVLGALSMDWHRFNMSEITWSNIITQDFHNLLPARHPNQQVLHMEKEDQTTVKKLGKRPIVSNLLY